MGRYAPAIAPSPDDNPLLRQLSSFATLSEIESAILDDLTEHTEAMDTVSDVDGKDASPTRTSLLLLTGMAVRYRIHPGGRRDLITFFAARQH